MKVLLLGGNGYMGPHVVRSIEGEHILRITDTMPIESPHETQLVDVTDIEQVRRAAEGMDAIINLSVLRHDRQLAFDVNTRGSYNTMQVAVEHGIERVINTGPHFTLAGQTYEDFDFGITPDIPSHPGTNLYAITKSLGQEVCRIFTDNYPLHVLTLLFLTFLDHDDQRQGTDLNPFTVSWRDCGESFRCALMADLETMPSPCECFFIVADLPHDWVSNQKAKQLLGFRPRDNFEAVWRKKT